MNHRADLTDEARTAREALIERIAETDDDLTMQYLEGEDLTAEELTKALKKGVSSGQVVPVLVASGLLNVDISQLLDTLVDYTPTPASRPWGRSFSPPPARRGPGVAAGTPRRCTGRAPCAREAFSCSCSPS